MKKFTIVLASAAALLAGPALAADLGVRPIAKAPAYVPAPMISNWSGFYIGIHGGGVWADADYFFPTTGFYGVGGNHVTHGMSGWMLGGHVGFNMQWNQIVLGIEGAGAWADIDGSRNSPFVTTDRFSTNINSIFSVTPRLGLAAGPALFYVKGGVAWGDIRTRLETTNLGINNVFDERRETRAGWTIGGGVEYMVAQSWVLGVEGNYYDFGIGNEGNLQSRFVNNGALAPVFSNHDTRVDAWSILGRLSYKFGSFGGPIAASY
ncbi:MAG: outer rane immunogenic protein [Variibacter sp.]|jgi:outer membrane immunogenic protein|nr:outer rane immunogenic protein [Variibacter sp.]